MKNKNIKVIYSLSPSEMKENLLKGGNQEQYKCEEIENSPKLLKYITNIEEEPYIDLDSRMSIKHVRPRINSPLDADQIIATFGEYKKTIIIHLSKLMLLLLGITILLVVLLHLF